MPEEAVELMLWLLPTTLLGSLAYVLQSAKLSTIRAIVGLVLFSTLSATSVGLGCLAMGKAPLVALVAGLVASLMGPFWVETARKMAERELAKRLGKYTKPKRRELPERQTTNKNDHEHY